MRQLATQMQSNPPLFRGSLGWACTAYGTGCIRRSPPIAIAMARLSKPGCLPEGRRSSNPPVTEAVCVIAAALDAIAVAGCELVQIMLEVLLVAALINTRHAALWFRTAALSMASHCPIRTRIGPVSVARW
jgi:hypothetical protein